MIENDVEGKSRPHHRRGKRSRNMALLELQNLGSEFGQATHWKTPIGSRRGVGRGG